MAKQMKQTTDDASKFFGEMEEKMDLQNSKRRKLSKEPGLSQPELSFLQFNPQPNTGKENICYFSNKCLSQPACNKNSLNKKIWKPPVKTLDGFDPFKLSCLNKENVYAQDTKPIKELLLTDTNVISNVDTNSSVQNTSIEVPSVLLTSLFRQPITKPQTLAIKLSNLSPSTTDNEGNSDSICQTTYSLSEISLASESVKSGSDLSPASSYLKDIYALKLEPCTSEKVNQKSLEDKSAPTLLKKENSGEPFLNEAVSNGYRERNYSENDFVKKSLDRPTSKIALENYEKKNCQVENNNKENTNYQEDETRLNFTSMLTQENHNLRDQNLLAVYKDRDYEDNNTVLDNSYKEVQREDEEVSSCNKEAYLKENDLTNNHTEHRIIINSIDLILSEGQNNLSQEEEENISNNNVEDQSNQALVDSVFDSSSNDEIELYDSINSTVAANNIFLEMRGNTKRDLVESITNKPRRKSSAEMVPENREKDLLTVNQEDHTNNKQVTPAIFPLPDSKNKTNGVNSRTTYNEPALGFNENIQQEQTMEVEDDDKNVCNVADDENSCLMISNSQLLEIENRYYETPLKKDSTGATSNDNNVKRHNETLSDKMFLSVGTQTEVFESMEQCVPFKTPHLQWPSKVVETQRRLRETIKEIQRLNSILLQVRQEIWPQNNTK